jgi:dTDP-4-amino-4,6-dideoxygalactose transaminase
VDLDPETLNIDLDDLRRKITPTTRVINLVHWSGIPNDLDQIKQIQADTRELLGFKPAVVEDCAHAMGSKYKGRYIGTHGNLATFSFQSIKTLTAAGDGGALSCPNSDMYKRSRLLRWYGLDRDDPSKVSLRCTGDCVEPGYKMHMNDVSAAAGLANLKDLDTLLALSRNNAAYYDANLKDVPGVRLIKRNPDHEPSFWIYSLLVENRFDFHRMMKEKGIFCNQVHERVDVMTCMKDFKCHLPNLDKVMPRITNLPVGFWVGPEEREYVVDAIKGGW